MTTQEARAIFTQAIEAAAAAGKDTSSIEIAREYFTNPEFRTKLEDYTWQINSKRK